MLTIKKFDFSKIQAIVEEYMEKIKNIDFSKLLDASILPLIIATGVTILVIMLASRRKEFESGRTVLGWIVAYILICIPVVSFIMLFIWAFGSKTKDDYAFRSWARLNLIMIMFVVVYSVALYALAGA